MNNKMMMFLKESPLKLLSVPHNLFFWNSYHFNAISMNISFILSESSPFPVSNTKLQQMVVIIIQYTSTPKVNPHFFSFLLDLKKGLLIAECVLSLSS